MAPLLHPTRAASAVVRRATAPIRLDRNYRPVAPDFNERIRGNRAFSYR
jgi:hypothetical protein